MMRAAHCPLKDSRDLPRPEVPGALERADLPLFGLALFLDPVGAAKGPTVGDGPFAKDGGRKESRRGLVHRTDKTVIRLPNGPDYGSDFPSRKVLLCLRPNREENRASRARGLRKQGCGQPGILSFPRMPRSPRRTRGQRRSQ